MKPRMWGNYWDYFGQKLVDHLDIAPGSIVLDLGTGGGSTLFPAAEATGQSGEVIGIELWDSMVDDVNKEIARCSIKNARVQKTDAREMDFEDGSFDVAIAGFIGFDNYFDFERCQPKAENTFVKQMVRVLRPGGRAGFSTWTLHEDTDYLYGILSAAWPEMEKPFSLENEKGWRIIMESLNLEDVRIIHDSLTYAFPSLKTWQAEIMEYGWKERIESVAEKSGVPQETLTQHILDNLGEHLKGDGSIAFRRDALYAIGTKPS
jgi:ubiquinone/menaquinone biosynthesis C-methylase UbiE